MESTLHGISKPDVFSALAIASPPVLLWYLGDVGVDTGFSSVHVTEDLNGISCAADVWINPVVAWQNETVELMRVEP